MIKKVNNVALFGATGHTGQRIVNELLNRSVCVTGVSRDTGAFPSPNQKGLSLVSGDLDDAPFRRQITSGKDALVLAVPPRLRNGREIAVLVPELLDEAEAAGYRLGIVGGAGTLRVGDDGPLLMDLEQFPAPARPVAESHARLLNALRDSRSGAEWFYLSPPAQFGANFPGKKTGSFRLEKDVLVTSDSGHSTISAEDYASAFANELFDGNHLRSRFSVGY